MKKVAIIMGSDSDLPIVQKAVAVIKRVYVFGFTSVNKFLFHKYISLNFINLYF